MFRGIWAVWALSACVLTGPKAQAGAWLEPEGRGFSALDLRLRDRGRELGFFGVYGLRQNVSLGLDLNDTAGGGAHAQAFVRLPIRQSDHGWQMAGELSLGANRQQARWQPMTKLALSAGRGFQLQHASGWVAADLARSFRDGGASRAWKLDATLGLNGHHRGAPLLQMEYYHPDHGEPSLALLPSWRFARKNGQSWLAGVELQRRFNRPATVSLRLGLWQPF